MNKQPYILGSRGCLIFTFVAQNFICYECELYNYSDAYMSKLDLGPCYSILNSTNCNFAQCFEFHELDSIHYYHFGPQMLHAWSLRCIIWFQLIHDGLYFIGFDPTMNNFSDDPSLADYNYRAHKSLLTTCCIKNSKFLGNPSLFEPILQIISSKKWFHV